MQEVEEYIHLSKYSRFLEKEKRRETWGETVDRYCDFFADHVNNMDISQENKDEILEVIG